MSNFSTLSAISASGTVTLSFSLSPLSGFNITTLRLQRTAFGSQQGWANVGSVISVSATSVTDTPTIGSYEYRLVAGNARGDTFYSNAVEVSAGALTATLAVATSVDPNHNGTLASATWSTLNNADYVSATLQRSIDGGTVWKDVQENDGDSARAIQEVLVTTVLSSLKYRVLVSFPPLRGNPDGNLFVVTSNVVTVV